MENRTAETEKTFDWKRIRHLLKLGIFSACMVMLGDVLLGWGVSDPKVTEIPRMFTRFLSVSDARIYASAMLGLVFIPIECLCWFAVYRMIQPYSPKIAHAHRAGIIGCLAFGGCGVHVPCCAAAWLLKRFYTANPNAVYGELLRWVMWFLIPATVIFFVFFLIVMITQWKAFSGGYTPHPRWICRLIAAKDFLSMSLAAKNMTVMKLAAPPDRWTPAGEDPEEHYRRIFEFEKNHYSYRTIYNAFWSANNYAVPDPIPEIDTTIEYWYGEGEKKARAENRAYVKKIFPQTTVREFRGLEHAELVLMFPKTFHAEIMRVWQKTA